MPVNVRKPRLVIVLIVVVIAIVVMVAIRGLIAGSGGNRIMGKITKVVALDSNTVRVYMTWTNIGTAAGSASCVLHTGVDNQLGDKMHTEVNSTATNGQIAPGHTQLRYQDIGVTNGDARYVTSSDVTIVSCSSP